jgi:hypothetical protein
VGWKFELANRQKKKELDILVHQTTVVPQHTHTHNKFGNPNGSSSDQQELITKKKKGNDDRWRQLRPTMAPTSVVDVVHHFESSESYNIHVCTCILNNLLRVWKRKKKKEKNKHEKLKSSRATRNITTTTTTIRKQEEWLTSHRVDTYKTFQANQVTRGFTRVSSDRQPRYYRVVQLAWWPHQPTHHARMFLFF